MTTSEQIEQLEQADEELTDYLERHEDDIAIDINDFGDLRNVFKLCIGRDAKRDLITK